MKNNPNAAYWRERFSQLEAAQNRLGQDMLGEIEKQYRAAERELEGQISRWYMRLAANNGISMAEARRLLAADELAEFKWDVWEYIRRGEENTLDGRWLKQLENASVKFHISRLEALKIHTRQSMEELFARQQGTLEKGLGSIYRSGYYHTAYELQRGFSVGWDIAGIDQAQLTKVLAKPWAADGRNFSERIWGNKTALINELHTELSRSIMLGEGPQKAIEAIAKKLKTSRNNAGRLVMTESAYFSSAAQGDCYNELGVEEYQIVATLDDRTSEICQEMDLKVFPMKDYQAGVTAPPFHVRCRSTTVPYFDDDFGVIGERAARGEDGKTYYVPADMSYGDWKKKFVKDAIKDSDRTLYDKYKDILGNNTPTLEKFLEIRHNKIIWSEFKAYSSSISLGELSVFTDFDLYQSICKEIDDKLLGVVTSNNITITGKSKHSVARIIGSVEQKRNGVQVSDILNALTDSKSEVLPIRQMKNGRSQKFRNSFVEVSVNPDTGNIIQVNPLHSRKKVKS